MGEASAIGVFQRAFSGASAVDGELSVLGELVEAADRDFWVEDEPLLGQDGCPGGSCVGRVFRITNCDTRDVAKALLLMFLALLLPFMFWHILYDERRVEDFTIGFKQVWNA